MLPPVTRYRFYRHPNGDRATCPSCGGNIFDNRDRKKTEKHPDLRCGGCGMVAWLDPTGGWRWSAPLGTRR